MTPDSPLRLAMWSGPRNVSTAVMYAFAQRPDTWVLDEPLYAHYLRVSGADHPGRDDVIASDPRPCPQVVERTILGPSPRPVLFMKMMAHHLRDIDLDFLNQTRNVLLTRDPREVLPTLAVQLGHPALADTGYKVQVDLLRRELAAGRKPVVLEARRLLEDPEAVLRHACDALGLPFTPAMLSWPAGPKPYDGVWASHWYQNVHRSQGFAPYRPKTEPFPEALEPPLAECLPLYEEIVAHAL